MNGVLIIFLHDLYPIKKYGKNIKTTGRREVFIPIYLRLMRLVELEDVHRCIWKGSGEGDLTIWPGNKDHIKMMEPSKKL